MKKRWLSALLALCMMLTMMPAAFAAGTEGTAGSATDAATTLSPAENGVYTLTEDVTINTIVWATGKPFMI